MSFSSRRPPFETLRPGTLRVAAFRGFAPFAWEESGEARGRDIAFLQRFAAARGLDLAVEFFDFDRLWELPAEDRADIAASGISFMPEKRKASISWSTPYSEVRRTLLIRKEDTELYHAAEDFAFARITVVACSAAHDHAKEALPSTITLSFCDSLQEGIADLLAGRVDAVGTGDVSARHHVAREPRLAQVDVHDARAPEYISFAVRPSLLEPLNAFIAEHAEGY